MSGKKDFTKAPKKIKDKKLNSFMKFQNNIKLKTAQNKSRGVIR